MRDEFARACDERSLLVCMGVVQENLDACSQDAAATAAEVSKQAAIMAAELAKRSHHSSNSPGWLTSMLINKIINSFQMRVHDVHIRVEADPTVSGGPSVAIGLVCQWVRSRSNKSVAGEQKLEVRGLSLYWDRDVEMSSLSEAALPEVAALFEKWGCADDKPESLPSVHEDEDGDIFYVAPSDDDNSFTLKHHWLLQPCDVDISLVLARDKSLSKLLLSIQSIPILLEVGQMWDIFRLLDWLQVVGIRRQFLHLRPRCQVSQDRRAWWRYSILSTLQHLNKTRWRLRWADMRVHLGQRREYAQLYRMVLTNKASGYDRRQLSYLESQVPPLTFHPSSLRSHPSPPSLTPHPLPITAPPSCQIDQAKVHSPKPSLRTANTHCRVKPSPREREAEAIG
jgi:hypothetical protein